MLLTRYKIVANTSAVSSASWLVDAFNTINTLCALRDKSGARGLYRVLKTKNNQLSYTNSSQALIVETKKIMTYVAGVYFIEWSNKISYEYETIENVVIGTLFYTCTRFLDCPARGTVPLTDKFAHLGPPAPQPPSKLRSTDRDGTAFCDACHIVPQILAPVSTGLSLAENGFLWGNVPLFNQDMLWT